MFADPQSVVYNAGTLSVPAIGRSELQSEYKLNSSGVVYDLTLGHAFKTRNRVFARLRRDAYASDPIVPANNILASMTASFVIDFPTSGLTVADAVLLGRALRDWASDAKLLQLCNGET